MNGVRLTLLDAGFCECPEHIVLRNGRWQAMRFPATFALLEHPCIGPMLLDTGYTGRFYTETRRFPYSLYARATPVTLREGECACDKLARRGIRAEEVERIFISHFHADHVGGLRDFPRARFVYLQHAYAAVCGKRGLAALRRGFLPGLLPDDFEARALPIDAAAMQPLSAMYAPFEVGVDLLGDGTLLAVELPGHATGQMGLFVQSETSESYFLVVDGCWASRAFRENRMPHPLANLIFADATAYRRTLARLHAFYRRRPDVHIIPAHCGEAYARYVVKYER
jgi:glyoxylase-like metal-dependent hydrolase (beta-lactamase superfamily II)